MSSLLPFGKKKEVVAEDPFELESWRTQLEQRISIVAGGLAGAGLQVAMLGTEELIELFIKYTTLLKSRKLLNNISWNILL
jgi:hypothetical protein